MGAPTQSAGGYPLWNVRVAVVDLVTATTERNAVAFVVARLEAAGFTVYHDTPDAGGPTAFESEPT